MKNYTLFSLLLFFLTFSLKSQISTNNKPYSSTHLLKNYTSSNSNILSIDGVFTLPEQDIQGALAQDILDEEKGLAPRFGLINTVNLNLNNSGTWVDLPNGDKLWRLRIKSPGAKSINLNYSQFHIPRGGMLHIYNESKTHIIGGFTSRNNQGTFQKPGKFATGLVYGDDIVLEYFHPYNSKDDAFININEIIHGYKFIELLSPYTENELLFGDSGSCQVNINCSEGNNWQDEKRGVALILVNGNRNCSGSLVNNTSQDGTPYFLTADHCIGSLDAPSGETNASNYTFYWNYESPNCANGTVEPNIQSTSGATLVANNSVSDFALFRLTESPLEDNIDVFFNGWDRTQSPTQGGVGIHHPSGDIKKIATHNQVPIPGQLWDSNSHWRVNWISTTNGYSVTEGGSSGSPLFMNNGRLIGQLHGGSSVNCSDPGNDPGEYGRFSVSWDGNARTRRLRDWLDPGNTGVNFLNGEIHSNFEITGPNSICSSGTFIVTNAPNGANTSWTVTPSSFFTTSSGTGSAASLQRASSSSSGNARITFTIQTGSNSSTISRNFTVGAQPVIPYMVYPNSYPNQSDPTNVRFDVCTSGNNNTIHLDLNGVSNLQAYTYSGASQPQVVNTSVYVDLPKSSYSATIRLQYDVGNCGSVVQFVTLNNTCRYSMVYPNPASEQVTIDLENDDKISVKSNYFSSKSVQVKVFNSFGILVHSEYLPNSKTLINVQSWTNGVYFFHFEGLSEETIIERVIVTH